MLVEWFHRSRRIEQASGAPFAGPQLDWPLELADAWDIMAQEDIRLQNAITEQIHTTT